MEVKIIICPKCGAEQYEDNNFCTACRNKLKKYCTSCRYDKKYHECGYDRCPDVTTFFVGLALKKIK